jgi:hypothetical protein
MKRSRTKRGPRRQRARPTLGDSFSRALAQTGAKHIEVFESVFGHKNIDDEILSADAVIDVIARRGEPWRGHSETKAELPEIFTHAAMTWTVLGFPTFRLTHSLCAALLLTECRGLKGIHLKLPFPCFRIELPYPDSPIPTFTETDEPGDVAPAKAIFVHVYGWPDSPDKTPLLAKYHERGKQFLAGALDESAYAKVVQETRQQLLWPRRLSLYTVAAKRDYVWRDTAYPDDTETLEKWLAPSDILGRTNELAHAAVRRLVINLCLYLDGLSGHDSSDLRFDAPQTTAPKGVRSWLLGKEIKLAKELRDAARAFAEGERQHAAWRIGSKFVVRGHWRNQAHGEGRKQRSESGCTRSGRAPKPPRPSPGCTEWWTRADIPDAAWQERIRSAREGALQADPRPLGRSRSVDQSQGTARRCHGRGS